MGECQAYRRCAQLHLAGSPPTVDLPQGRAREPLLLLKEGLAALGEALQVLLGLCSPEVDYVSSTDTSQPPFFLLLLP